MIRILFSYIQYIYIFFNRLIMKNLNLVNSVWTNTSQLELTKDKILALDPSDYNTANKMIVSFLKSHWERGFDTIAKEWRVLLLLKNEQQVEDIIKILQPTELNIRRDRLMKLSLTIDLKDLELNLPPSGPESDEILTNESIFE